MTNGLPPTDPRWHRLLGLAVHEFRNPVTVVGGYVRMLLSGRAGELTDKQRYLLREAEKSCVRLAGLITEMSDLAELEEGTAKIRRSTVEVGSLLEDTIASLPPLPDREVTIALTNEAPGATIQGDSTRLKAAFAAVLTALRRELVTSTQLLVRLRRDTRDGRPVLRVSLAGHEDIDRVDRSEPSELGAFNEWRGGCGLSLAVARCVVLAHDGWLWSPIDDPKAGAVMMLPEG